MVALPDLRWLPQAPHWQPDWPAIDRACPWLAGLADTPQDPIYHGEGDVLTHTRMVAEALVADADWRALPADERAVLFISALFHDIAKPNTTTRDSDGRLISPGHARLGAEMARRMLMDTSGIGFVPTLPEREQIVALVRLHGLPLWFIERENLAQTAIPASLRIKLELVALLAEADVHGRICDDSAELLARIELFRDWCAEHACLSQPYPFANDHSRVRFCQGMQSDPAYAAYDTSWGEVVLLSGLPGAGKDTWIREHGQGLPVISLDAIREEHGVKPEENQGNVAREAKEQAREYLRKHQPFIWNATNLSRRMRDPLVELFLSYGAHVRIVYLDAPLAQILQRNQQRARSVPSNVIQRMAGRLEPPDRSEAHKVEWILTTDNK